MALISCSNSLQNNRAHLIDFLSLGLRIQGYHGTREKITKLANSIFPQQAGQSGAAFKPQITAILGFETYDMLSKDCSYLPNIMALFDKLMIDQEPTPPLSRALYLKDGTSLGATYGEMVQSIRTFVATLFTHEIENEEGAIFETEQSIILSRLTDGEPEVMVFQKEGSLLGRGRYGFVHRGLLLTSKRHEKVALKFGQNRGTVNEADRLQDLEEVNIPIARVRAIFARRITFGLVPFFNAKLKELHQSGDVFVCIAMDLFDGNLSQLPPNLPLLKIKQIAIQLLEMIDHLQQLKLTHRDLKLGNILFKKEGEGFALAFGDAGTIKNVNETTSRDSLFLNRGNYVVDVLETAFIRALNASQTSEIRQLLLKRDRFAASIIVCKLLTSQYPFQTYHCTKYKAYLSDSRSFRKEMIHRECPSNVAEILILLIEDKISIREAIERLVLCEEMNKKLFEDLPPDAILEALKAQKDLPAPRNDVLEALRASEPAPMAVVGTDGEGDSLDRLDSDGDVSMSPSLTV